MSKWYSLLLCAGVLVGGASSASAHTTKVCWRVETNGTVTMFAGTYHGGSDLAGGIYIDGMLHDFTGSTPALPADVTGCQADCGGSAAVRWQTANVAVPFGSHTVDLTATSAIEAPWPGCYPASFTFGAKLATTLLYTGATSGQYASPVTVAAIMRPVIVGAPIVFTLDGGETCTATLDGSGIASCPLTPLQPAGTYPLTASYAGNAGHLPSSTTVPFTVTKRPTTLTYTGATTSPYSVPATVAAQLSPAVAGATIVFTLAGAETCSGIANAAGVASCEITPMEAAGTYPLTAVFAGDGGHLPSSVTVPFVVTKLPTTLVYTGATTSDYHDPAIVAAQLSPAVAGAAVVFTLAGAETCADVIDGAGVASCALTPQQPAGIYPLIASYAGDDRHLPSSVTVPFTVTREQTTLVYTGDTYAANAEPARLAGVLREDGVTPIAGRTIHFTLGEGPAAQQCSGVTDASGAAACVIDAVDQPLNADATIAIAASFAGDAYYLPSAAAGEALHQYMTGAAHAISGTAHVVLGKITIPRTPNTGDVRTADASTTTTPCTAAVSAKLLGIELVGAKLLCANVTTDVAPGSSVATASLERATVALGGLLPTIGLTGITARSESSCDGASGHATIASLTIGGLSVPIGLAPNTIVGLPLGGRITINEQVPDPDADHGLTVIAAHIFVPPVLGLAGVDLVLGSARSGIHNCRPEPVVLIGDLDDVDVDVDVDGDGVEPAGGCQATRSGGAAWLIALALVAVRRRRRLRGRATPGA